MNRRISAWLFAAVPATLVGHAFVYAVTGQSQVDGRHGYLAPSLEYSGVLLAAFCVVALFRAFARVDWESAFVTPFPLTWARLAATQMALFAVIEHFEGYGSSLNAYALQALVALIAAVGIAYFARLLARCERSKVDASLHLRRLLVSVELGRAARLASSPAYALSISAGRSRFQRPPPQL